MTDSYSDPNAPRRGRGYLNTVAMSLRGGNYSRVRNTLQIPFHDSIDSSNALECFFQMPANVDAIRQAKVWVQRKSFRAYSTAAASGGGSSPTSGQIQNTVNAATTSNSDGTTDTASGHLHLISASHAHTYIGNHDHTVTIGAHTHGLTYSINETAASGTVSLFVADDGSSYGSAIVSGSSAITAQTILPSLTKSSGDKRIKITATGLMRVQVLLLLDLVLIPLGPGQQ